MRSFFKIAAFFAVAFASSNSLVAAPLYGANADEFYVVVNSANNFSGTDTETKTLVRRLFLKSIKKWPGGEKAVPFSRKDTNPAQAALLTEILSMSNAEYGQYWARQKQTTGDTPPHAVGSKSILLRLIRREPGAVGIINGSGPEPKGVKVLMKISNQAAF